MENKFENKELGFILEELRCASNVEELDNESDWYNPEKVLTPLEKPKTKTQLTFCETLTKRMKQEEEKEFTLNQIENNINQDELVEENMNYNENMCFKTPELTSSVVSNCIESKNVEIGIIKTVTENNNKYKLEKTELPKEKDLKEIHLPNANSSNHTKTKDVSMEPLNNNQNSGINHRKVFKRKLNTNVNQEMSQNSMKEIGNRSKKSSYTPGTVVWAKVVGYSFWPAMIDEDPDYNTYVWNANTSCSSGVTHYHVVFFDTKDRLSRSWIKLNNIKPFDEVVKINSRRPAAYISRFKESVKSAKEASSMNVKERLKKYSFKERINRPGIKLCQD